MHYGGPPWHYLRVLEALAVPRPLVDQTVQHCSAAHWASRAGLQSHWPGNRCSCNATPGIDP